MSQEVPKPLSRVQDIPLIDHIVAQLARQQVGTFIVAAGHKAQEFHEWAASRERDGHVVVVDTGPDSSSYTRFLRCLEIAAGFTSQVLLTYGDGLADLDLMSLLDVHAASNRPCTVSVYDLPCQWGVVDFDAEGVEVVGFRQKPRISSIQINIGYMLFDVEANVEWARYGELESGLLADLARSKKLAAYRHKGYWRSVDTVADLESANAEASKGIGPWMSDGRR